MDLTTLSLRILSNQTIDIHEPHGAPVSALQRYVDLPSHDYYFTRNGRIAAPDSPLAPGSVYHVVPRLLGGKGGFGSMLRALGAQIEKTTNREACRDLSGRRMRDVNNEKKLKEWVDKKAEREQERARKRQEKRERRQQFLTDTRHNFDDPNYHKQKMQVTEHLEDALQQGLQKKNISDEASSSSTSSRKRKSQDPVASSSAKKASEWLGMEDLSDLSDSSSSSDSDDSAVVPGPSSTSVAASTSSAAQDATGGDSPGAPSTSPNDAQGGHSADALSDSGVESVGKPVRSDSSSGNSPMDVDSTDTNIGKRVPERQIPSPGKDDNTAVVKPESSDTAENPKTGGLLAALPPPKAQKEEVTETGPVELELLSYGSVDELEALGLDVLKAALMARGLKCGGTLQQRAERLWMVRGKDKDDIDPALFAKCSKGKGKGKK